MSVLGHLSRDFHLEIHIPISPTPGFLNRLRYLFMSWRMYGDPGFRYRFVITVGADQDPEELMNRVTWVRDFPVVWRWFDRDLFRRYSWWGTINDRFRAEFAADHVLLMDADMVFTRSIRDAFALVQKNGGIAGVPAYETPFRNLPWDEGAIECWRRLFIAVGLREPAFEFVHSATGMPSPAYYNNGFLLLTAESAIKIGRVIFGEMDACEQVVGKHPFRDQIALTLAIYRLGIEAISLPLRFNHFIGETAVGTAKYEWQHARVIHYTSNDFFNSETDAESLDTVSQWLDRTASSDITGLRGRFRETISGIHRRLVVAERSTGQTNQMHSVAIIIRSGHGAAALARAAAICCAIRNLNWRRWQPRVCVVISGNGDSDPYHQWLPHLRDAVVMLVPTPMLGKELSLCGGADVIMEVGTNTLPIADFEDVLDYTCETCSIAGVISRDALPGYEGISAYEFWRGVSDVLTRSAIELRYKRTLSLPDDSEEAQATPFYVGDGPLFIPGRVVGDLSECYAHFRQRLVQRLSRGDAVDPIAMTLAIAETGAKVCALPIRYNFPVDERAASFPEELADVRLFHYQDISEFKLSRLFENEARYKDFLELPLGGVSLRFQQRIRHLFGSEYPFISPAQNLLGSPQCGNWRSLLTTSAGIKGFKRALIKQFGIDAGFALYRETMKEREIEEIHLRPLQGQQLYAKSRGEFFFEWGRAGEPFVIESPVIDGRRHAYRVNRLSRSAYVSCLGDAQVRGASGLIKADGIGLFDFQGSELDWFDWEMDIDPSIFQSCNERAWVITARGQRASTAIDEAFMLLGPQTGGFGDWMQDYLPRYVAANLSGVLPPVPVLIDLNLPPVHRRSLEMMLPRGVELIPVPGLSTVHVRRLWCASTLFYAPTWEKMDQRFSYAHRAPPPTRFARVTEEMRRHADCVIPEVAGPERIFLARRASLWRKLVNEPQIEAVAKARGFSIVIPEELDFAGQVNLIRNARFLIVPEGSAVCLSYFGRPGLKLCILNHTLVEWPMIYSNFLAGTGVEITILTGSIVRNDPEFLDRADYVIDERRFCSFLDSWMYD